MNCIGHSKKNCTLILTAALNDWEKSHKSETKAANTFAKTWSQQLTQETAKTQKAALKQVHADYIMYWKS
jgi:hypothetical protein